MGREEVAMLTRMVWDVLRKVKVEQRTKGASQGLPGGRP